MTRGYTVGAAIFFFLFLFGSKLHLSHLFGISHLFTLPQLGRYFRNHQYGYCLLTLILDLFFRCHVPLLQPFTLAQCCSCFCHCF